MLSQASNWGHPARSGGWARARFARQPRKVSAELTVELNGGPAIRSRVAVEHLDEDVARVIGVTDWGNSRQRRARGAGHVGGAGHHRPRACAPGYGYCCTRIRDDIGGDGHGGAVASALHGLDDVPRGC